MNISKVGFNSKPQYARVIVTGNSLSEVAKNVIHVKAWGSKRCLTPLYSTPATLKDGSLAAVIVFHAPLLELESAAREVERGRVKGVNDLSIQSVPFPLPVQRGTELHSLAELSIATAANGLSQVKLLLAQLAADQINLSNVELFVGAEQRCSAQLSMEGEAPVINAMLQMVEGGHFDYFVAAFNAGMALRGHKKAVRGQVISRRLIGPDRADYPGIFNAFIEALPRNVHLVAARGSSKPIDPALPGGFEIVLQLITPNAHEVDASIQNAARVMDLAITSERGEWVAQP